MGRTVDNLEQSMLESRKPRTAFKQHLKSLWICRWNLSSNTIDQLIYSLLTPANFQPLMSATVNISGLSFLLRLSQGSRGKGD